jgi:hypothetical protein
MHYATSYNEQYDLIGERSFAANSARVRRQFANYPFSRTIHYSKHLANTGERRWSSPEFEWSSQKKVFNFDCTRLMLGLGSGIWLWFGLGLTLLSNLSLTIVYKYNTHPNPNPNFD